MSGKDGRSDGSIQVEIVSSHEDLLAVYRLRYAVYCYEMHSLDPKDYPDGLEYDYYDQYSVHIVAKVGNDVIGTLRLIKETPCGFLMEESFPLPDWVDRAKAVEHSRGVMRKDYRGKGIFRLILDKAYRWQRENGYPICIGTPVMQTLGPIILKDGWQPLEDQETTYHNVSVIPMVFYLDERDKPSHL